MTLYLKYRPQTVDELDLERVRESLKKIVASGRIPHAFLFAGPKGTGKTSAARILAKIVNCQAKPDRALQDEGLPCNKCGQCLAIQKGSSLDVVELDAASHRGIDDIRALRENVALSPSSGKKKVYIIDEAHMLTTEAANAFLKTLEEPPEHVIFIFATTDPHRLPETVRSRLTHIIFRKATLKEVGRQLERVIAGEKIKVEEGVVDAIAKAADGSFRDAVKILEQLSLESKKITKKTAEDFLQEGMPQTLDAFFSCLADKDREGSLRLIEDGVAAGLNIRNYVDLIFGKIHKALLAGEGLPGEALPGFTKQELLDLIKLLSDAKCEMAFCPVTQLPLEIAVIKWCHAKRGPALQDGAKKKDQEIESPEIKDVVNLPWQAVMTAIRPQNSSVEALLRAARPVEFDGQTLKLGVFYKFHKEKLETPQYTGILESTIETVIGAPVRVVCILTEPEKKEEKPQKEPVLTEPGDKDIIQTAKEIFGS